MKAGVDHKLRCTYLIKPKKVSYIIIASFACVGLVEYHNLMFSRCNSQLAVDHGVFAKPSVRADEPHIPFSFEDRARLSKVAICRARTAKDRN